MKFRNISLVLGIGIIILILVGWCLINLTQKEEKEIYFNNLSINKSLTSQPTTIHFNANKLEFSDKTLNLTFDSYFLFNLNNVSILEFNIGNESYKFVKEETTKTNGGKK